MPKFNAKNERVKHRYLAFLTEARQLSVATVDQIAAAIADFEQSTGYREFRLFRPGAHLSESSPQCASSDGTPSHLMFKRSAFVLQSLCPTRGNRV